MSEDIFEITHQTKVLDFQGDRLSCVIDTDPETKQLCNELLVREFDYNLKGIILKKPDGHQLGCRFIIKDDLGVLDYKCAPTNEWITELRRTKRIGIIDKVGVVMMICDDLWTGDIEEVLKRFYSANQGE